MRVIDKLEKLVKRQREEGTSPTLYDLEDILHDVEKLVEDKAALHTRFNEVNAQLNNSPRWEEIAKATHGELAQRIRDYEYREKLTRGVDLLPATETMRQGQVVRSM